MKSCIGTISADWTIHRERHYAANSVAIITNQVRYLDYRIWDESA